MTEINRYFSLTMNGKVAEIFIYGDIVVPEWQYYESDTSGYSLAKDLQALEADEIHVHINSYGGHVSEGLAIYNQLKTHSAKVVTYCDGFACSAASVVFMAGDERVMNSASLLMIHNAWTYAAGDAEALRKEANDLETITQASVNAYLQTISIDEVRLKELLDAESWLLPEEAVSMGFATAVREEVTSKASQNARKSMLDHFKLDSAQNRESPTSEEILQKLMTALEAAKPPDEPPDDPPAQNTKTFFNFKEDSK